MKQPAYINNNGEVVYYDTDKDYNPWNYDSDIDTWGDL